MEGDDLYMDVVETTYFDVEPRPSYFDVEPIRSSAEEPIYESPCEPSFVLGKSGGHPHLGRERAESFYADFSSLAHSNETGEFNERLLVANKPVV
jgi:hypothetical protein